MSITNLYPNQRPEIIYNVLNGRPELPVSSTFTRASDATYVDKSGYITTAVTDEARFNYDPVTGTFLGLLLENEKTNVVEYSEDFNSGNWNPVRMTLAASTELAPDGTTTATKFIPNTDNQSHYNKLNVTVSGADPSTWAISVYVKADGYNYAAINANVAFGTADNYCFITYDLQNITVDYTQNGNAYGLIEDAGNGWRRLTWVNLNNEANTFNFSLGAQPVGGNPGQYVGNNVDGCLFWGAQAERIVASSYIKTSGATATRAADVLSLSTNENFDDGFSLLLDSETTTEDFVYKIKATGTEIASLENDNGTLNWVINGTSAASQGDYPQVGFTKGRVKTISSFGPANQGVQENYLYTTGISFPTEAEPAAGANSIEFGTPQTVKALYVWNGQLDPINAVSLIKGILNIVPNEPIQANSYSFVYNTDPTDVGNVDISLPYISPTVSMTVNWGDGTSDSYAKTVLPTHTYPYPGQYRIQIISDNFDTVRLGDVDNTITRVDQWPPQFRVGAAGDGFTGDQMQSLLAIQGTNKLIPPYKYTNLTNITNVFENNGEVAVNGWDFIPIDLQSCTNIGKAFSYIGGISATPAERAVFPQLKTSSLLTNASNLLVNTNITGFVTENGVPTNRPLTNTSNVTQFNGAFLNCKLTDIDLDLSSALNLNFCFYGNDFDTMPNLGFGTVTQLNQTWYKCAYFTGFSSLPDFSSVTTASTTWASCTSLVNQPSQNFPENTNFESAWADCTSLTTVGTITAPKCTKWDFAFANTALASFPNIVLPTNIDFTARGLFNSCPNLVGGGSTLDYSRCIHAQQIFSGSTSLATMPAVDAPNNVSLYQAYRGTAFSTVVAMDTSSVTQFAGLFQYNSVLSDVTEFANWDISKGITFNGAFNICSSLVDFPPNVFDTTGTLVSNAFELTWKQASLNAQSIENILVSLDINGQSNIQLSIDGGFNAAQPTWSATANAAFNSLVNKGWTIAYNA